MIIYGYALAILGRIERLIGHGRAARDEKSRGPEYRRGYADGRNAERAGQPEPTVIRTTDGQIAAVYLPPKDAK